MIAPTENGGKMKRMYEATFREQIVAEAIKSGRTGTRIFRSATRRNPHRSRDNETPDASPAKKRGCFPALPRSTSIGGKKTFSFPKATVVGATKGTAPQTHWCYTNVRQNLHVLSSHNNRVGHSRNACIPREYICVASITFTSPNPSGVFVMTSPFLSNVLYIFDSSPGTR